MTPKQLLELFAYIKENNSWGEKMYNCVCERNRKAVKYVDVVWDSRNNTVYTIELRLGFGESKRFRVGSQSEINEVYKWLDTPLNKDKSNEN